MSKGLQKHLDGSIDKVMHGYHGLLRASVMVAQDENGSQASVQGLNMGKFCFIPISVFFPLSN